MLTLSEQPQQPRSSQLDHEINHNNNNYSVTVCGSSVLCRSWRCFRNFSLSGEQVGSVFWGSDSNGRAGGRVRFCGGMGRASGFGSCRSRNSASLTHWLERRLLVHILLRVATATFILRRCVTSPLKNIKYLVCYVPFTSSYFLRYVSLVSCYSEPTEFL